MHLFVQTYGAFIATHQGRLRVTKDKARLDDAPLLHLDQVIVSGNGIGINSDAVRACSEQGVPIHFLSSRGTPHRSRYSAELTGTVLTRRAQLRAYDDARGVTLAKAFTTGKVQTQANLLRSIAKYRKEADLELHGALTQTASDVVDTLHPPSGLRRAAACFSGWRRHRLLAEHTDVLQATRADNPLRSW